MDGWFDGRIDSRSTYIKASSRRTPANGERIDGITTRREQDKQQYIEENAMENIQLRARRLFAEYDITDGRPALQR